MSRYGSKDLGKSRRKMINEDEFAKCLSRVDLLKLNSDLSQI
jgi:hypothetical protein